jgi:hypothetical protein
VITFDCDPFLPASNAHLNLTASTLDRIASDCYGIPPTLLSILYCHANIRIDIILVALVGVMDSSVSGRS